MDGKEHFDFWYAVNNTEVLLTPSRRLETFGATVLNYHLVTQLMDSVDQVKVREGRMEAARPEIVTPQSFLETPLEGFGAEAAQYVEWLRHHAKDLQILRYGFKVRKQEQNEYVITDGVQAVADRVRTSIMEKDDPMSALAIGVDQPWEVCLLKMMVEVVENSAAGNVQDLRDKGLLQAAPNDPKGIRRLIEQGFLAAAKDPAKVDELGRALQKYGLFEEYQDRFFALVQGHRGKR
jgi:hypothetical protein